MSLYNKDKNGNLTKIAGHLTQRINARWFPCARKVENGIEYYDVPKDVEEYYKPFNSYLVYSLGFMEPNTTKTPKLRYNDKVLDLYDITNDDGLVNIGQLCGVYQAFTKNTLTDKRMYFCGSSHRDAYYQLPDDIMDRLLPDTSTGSAGQAVILGSDGKPLYQTIMNSKDYSTTKEMNEAIGNEVAKYLPLTGNKTITGQVTMAAKTKHVSGSMDNNNAAMLYYVGIKAFADGGEFVYRNASSILTDLGGLSSATASTTYVSKTDASATYFPKSGGTIAGNLTVTGSTTLSTTLINGALVAYRYSINNDAPAIIFDKPGANFTGIGSKSGKNNTICFGPVNSSVGAGYVWADSPDQIWEFQGQIRAKTASISEELYAESINSPSYNYNGIPMPTVGYTFTGDLNTLKAAGITSVRGTAAHVPVSTDGYLVIMKWDSNSKYCSQIYLTEDNRLFTRVNMSSSGDNWTNWREY